VQCEYIRGREDITAAGGINFRSEHDQRNLEVFVAALDLSAALVVGGDNAEADVNDGGKLLGGSVECFLDRARKGDKVSIEWIKSEKTR
jgi:hypothetical protein